MIDPISQVSDSYGDLEMRGNKVTADRNSEHLEAIETGQSLDHDFLATFSDARRNKIIRKMDIRLLPLLCSLYGKYSKIPQYLLSKSNR